VEIVNNFLNFVAEVATVSYVNAIDAMWNGDQDGFERNKSRTDLLSAVANIDGEDRWTPVKNQVRREMGRS